MLESSLLFFMPPRSHSFILFLAVVLLIPAFCLLTSWQRRQKEDKIAGQFAELAASRPRRAARRSSRGLFWKHSAACIRARLPFAALRASVFLSVLRKTVPAALFRRSSAFFRTAAF